jgi:5-(aminomethyl)-3-furanmethanol phosphate kinase
MHTSCDVFVKFGGSVLDQHAATAALVPHITRLADKQRIVILTGGGQTVKRIKANQRSLGTPFYSCWRAGVLCLEVNAHLLASYSTQFKVVSSLADIAACFAAGHIGVFAPLGAMVNSLSLVPDWEETTDSIGLHFANALAARHYVIVSDVDGIYEQRPGEISGASPIPRLNVDELERLPSSKLDSAFPRYFRRQGLPTVIVNGRHPDRVSAAIRGEPTIGTRIDLNTH